MQINWSRVRDRWKWWIGFQERILKCDVDAELIVSWLLSTDYSDWSIRFLFAFTPLQRNEVCNANFEPSFDQKAMIDPFRRVYVTLLTIEGYIFSKGLRKARDTFTLASQKWENNRKGCSASRQGVISWGNRRDRAALNERKRNLIPRYRHANTMFALASKEITEETKMWDKENDRRTSLVKSLLPSGIPLKKSFRSRLCNLGSSNFLIHILFSLYFPSLLFFVLRSTRIRKRDIISFSPFSWYS